MITMRVRVFGGLRLWRAGIEVELGPARQRAVLAVLLAARGTVVSTSELVDAIWGDRPPDSAVNQVRRLIGQVRRLFEPDLPNREDGAWVKPMGDGYRLSLDARVSDLAAFFALVDEARAAAGADAAQKYEQALRLARDQPFAELPPALTGLPAFRAIETARVQAAVEAADAALGEPPAHHLLPLLQAYAAAAPLHEPLQARMVRLLTAAGRRAEGLAHFEEIRRRLADELGADPGTELRAAHLDAVTDPETPDPARPAQLPLRVAAFSPRPDLADGMAAGRGSGLIVLNGMGGSGKTALAVDWAHRIAGDYPDGQLYLDLRGFEPGGRQLRPVEALATLLLSVGATPNGSADPSALGAQFRSVMAKQRMLVLLDNARDSAQVRPLLPAAPGCLVVVTSRNRMPSLVAREGAWPVHVDRLSSRASKDVLALRLGAARLAGEPAAADRLVRLCAGLPLALSIAAARIAVSPRMSLNDVAAELAPAGRRLDGLATGEQNDDVRSALSWSYTILTAPAARLFRLLAVHPAAAISTGVANSIAGADVRAALTELATANMITPLGAGRNTMHDLLHAYAAELLNDDARDRLEAERRLVVHYVHSARNSYVAFRLRPPLDLDPPPDDVFAAFVPDVAAALDWYDRERAAVLGAVELALNRGWLREAALIQLHLRPVRSVRLDLTADDRRPGERTLRGIEALGDLELEALMLREMAIQLKHVDRASAHQYLFRALAIAERRGDLISQAHVLRVLASSPTTSGQDRHRDYAERSVAAARQGGDPSVLAYALNVLSIVLTDSGFMNEGAAAIAEAYALAEEAGMTDFQINVALQRASWAYDMSEDALAVEVGEWAMAHSPPGNILTLYSASWLLAKVYHRLGDAVRARTAADLFGELARRHEEALAETFSAEKLAKEQADIDRVLAEPASAKGGK
ncbi:AfsR/SARP family transcriptional regulator [Paractinoplanes hotanensis]|uniref:NB-ARC domain-containing protein n=1 Tax=Paractinoplanes hotanensis TaxID=2906497 RepID=A0ABT0Y5W3_9ACTN|nr:BTAD domain-containing putative transcriptional regulator [Actinoplanes hotanensis]MCM4080928.1 NB-ARC domain-containing protein [Actinoplanes hotanensis]